MGVAQERHERLRSAAYLDDLADARELIENLRKNGCPLARLVWRARSLYHKAWLSEKMRR